MPPDTRPAAQGTTAEHIRDHGWSFVYVKATQPDEQPFCYTIGFTETYQAPEILVFGLGQQRAHDLLSHCAELLANGHTFCAGIKDGKVLAGGYSVVFKPLREDCYGEYVGRARHHYRDAQFNVLVMFFPDREHCFPWDTPYQGSDASEPMRIVQSAG